MSDLVFDGNQIDTLVQLVEDGPLEETNVHSRAAVGDLILAGLAVKIVIDGERGYVAATAVGATIYCNRIVGVEQLERAVQTRKKRGVIRQLAR